MTVYEVDADTPLDQQLVGPVVRSGPVAEAVIDAVEEDNPGRDVFVVDRDDYVRVHTARECRLTRASLEKFLGQPIQLAALEIDMPAFKGRLTTRTDVYVWFHTN
jgi:toluene monooxygenase system protein D